MNTLLAIWGKATTYYNIITILYIYSSSKLCSSTLRVFLIACCNIWIMRRGRYFSNIRRVSCHHHYPTISSPFKFHAVTCCARNIWSSILTWTRRLRTNTWVSDMPSNKHWWISWWTPCLLWCSCCGRIHNILMMMMMIVLSFIDRMLRVLSRRWNRWWVRIFNFPIVWVNRARLRSIVNIWSRDLGIYWVLLLGLECIRNSLKLWRLYIALEINCEVIVNGGLIMRPNMY